MKPLALQPQRAGQWLYKITFYGGNQTELWADGIISAVLIAAPQGRVTKVEETYTEAVAE